LLLGEAQDGGAVFLRQCGEPGLHGDVHVVVGAQVEHDDAEASRAQQAIGDAGSRDAMVYANDGQ